MIDVIIPAYNTEKTLGRCLASLAAQTDRDFRVTVVDDCSSPGINLGCIVDGFRHLLKDIRYIKLPENVGAGMARQYGIDHTDGEWIAFLDADDVFMPYAIEAFKIIIADHPEMNVLHSSFYRQHITEYGHLLEEVRQGYTWLHGKLYRREFLEKHDIRNKPEYSRWADDGFFNAQCSELTQLTMNSLPMYVWTDTAGSTTNVDRNSGRKNALTLMNAMYDAAMHTLTHGKDTVGHLHNTIEGIRYEMMHTDVPFTEEEKAAFERLEKLYNDFGVKPEKPKKPKKRGLFRR